MLKIEEGDGPMLELRANDSPRRQTESVTIKPQRSLQIIDPQRNDRDPRLHRLTSAPSWKCETGYDSDRKVSTFRGGTPRASKWGPTSEKAECPRFLSDCSFLLFLLTS